MKKALMYLALLLISLSFVNSSYKIDENKLYADGAVPSDNIVVSQKTLLDYINPFVIYTNKGTYQLGETARFTFEEVSWAVWCRNPGEIVELYSPNGFVKSFYKTGTLGNPGGTNTKYFGYFDYTIETNAPKGSWALADYLWCFDTDYPTLNPQKFSNYNRRISNVGTAVFQVGSPTCDITYSRIINDWSTCSSGKQSRTVGNSCGDTKTEVRECTTPTCKPNWQCQEWGPCSLGTQSRTCNDANSCNLVVNSPVTSQSCGTTPPPPPNLCGNGLWDSGETCENCVKDSPPDLCSSIVIPPIVVGDFPLWQIGIVVILIVSILAIVFMRKR